MADEVVTEEEVVEVPVEEAPSDRPDETRDKEIGHGGNRNYRKVRSGVVVSDKMDKTIVVQVEDRVKHALYGKVMRRSSRLKAHDEGNVAGIGDRVRLMETRPLSATKRWRLVEIIEKAR